MKARLQKVLASAGVASRRGAEAFIISGEVTVNGRVARLGESVDPEVDIVAFRGRPVRTQAAAYLALNKPAGYVASARSTHGERTVFDLVDAPERVFPVGRLDKQTSGLLLLGNDGDWANVVTHPRYEIEKEYRATVRGIPSDRTLRLLAAGVTLPDGGVTAPARVIRMGDDGENAQLAITLIEGKKRQIRLMLASVGHPVLDLRRVRIGCIVLATLQPGQWRHLQSREVEGIRELGRKRHHGSSRA